MNLGFLGKGNASLPEPLREQIDAGAIGLKLHEDWGTTPAAIDCCLTVADEMDVAGRDPHRHAERVGFVEATVAAFKGRTIHTYPHRGRGRRPRAGHHQGVRRAERAAVVDQPDAAVHGQHDRRAPRHADGVPPPRSRDRRGRRVRRSRASAARRSPPRTSCTTSAPSRMMSSDSQAMGRVGEVIIRTWQTAHKMKVAARRAARATRRATTTSASSATSPSTRSTRRSRTASRTRSARSRSGKLADLVLWKPAFFGVKPSLILKGGMIALAQMGDPNASIPTPQPVHYRPMFGAFGGASREARSPSCRRRRWTPGWPRAMGCARRRSPVRNCRSVAQGGHGAQRLPAADRGRSRDLRRARRRRAADVRAGAACCRWRSATSCSDHDHARPSPARPERSPPRRSRSPSTRDARAACGRARRRGGRRRDPAVRRDAARRRPRRIEHRAASCAWSPRPSRCCSSTRSHPRELARAAYHLGNRHVAVEVGEGLRIAPDHVLRGMLEGLGARVESAMQPFEPEAGAYGGHRHGPAAARIARRPGRREAGVVTRGDPSPVRRLAAAAAREPDAAGGRLQLLAGPRAVRRRRLDRRRGRRAALDRRLAPRADRTLRGAGAGCGCIVRPRVDDAPAFAALERAIRRQPRDERAARGDAADGLLARHVGLRRRPARWRGASRG